MTTKGQISNHHHQHHHLVVSCLSTTLHKTRTPYVHTTLTIIRTNLYPRGTAKQNEKEACTGCLSGMTSVSSISRLTSAYPAKASHPGASPAVLAPKNRRRSQVFIRLLQRNILETSSHTYAKRPTQIQVHSRCTLWTIQNLCASGIIDRSGRGNGIRQIPRAEHPKCISCTTLLLNSSETLPNSVDRSAKGCTGGRSGN